LEGVDVSFGSFSLRQRKEQDKKAIKFFFICFFKQ